MNRATNKFHTSLRHPTKKELSAMATKQTTTKKLGVWETLSAINCNEWVEKKGKFDYLSWTHAWSILMKHYPDSTFFNHLNEDGYPCFLDPKGNAMVRVSLTVQDVEHTEDFAITDNYNNSILFPDSSDVNTALKRCLVKAMAWHGLGSYIYAGEDLPTTTQTSSVKTTEKTTKKTTKKTEKKKHQVEPDIDDEIMGSVISMRTALMALDSVRPKEEVLGWEDKSVNDCLEWYVEQAEKYGWGEVTSAGILGLTKTIYIRAESHE